MNDFAIYQQAVRLWLVSLGQEPTGFVFYGDGFATFGVMWNDPSEAVELDQAEIQVFYDDLVNAEIFPQKTLEERLEEFDVEMDLFQEILAYLMGVEA